MSLVFTNYDRTQLCDHVGVLGRLTDDGTRTCIRCGKTVQAEKFTKPAGRKSGRPSEPRAPR